jgi:uncharacterized protein (DUF433 family)
MADELLSPAEVEAVAGVPLRAVYKAIERRLPAGLVIRRNRQPLLTRWGAICIAIDHEMPKDVPMVVRRQLYAQIKRSSPSREVRCKRGPLHYVIDVKAAADKIDASLAKYRKAMKLIVEDPGIQAGAATFRGTRILVHQVADLMSQGATEAELQEDYPRLTREMMAAAKVYVKAHPRRGRPRKPSWRSGRPLSVQVVERRRA